MGITLERRISEHFQGKQTIFVSGIIFSDGVRLIEILDIGFLGWVGLEFLRRAQKIDVLQSNKAQAQTSLKGQARTWLKLNFQGSNWPGLDPSLPVPKLYDSIYQSL